MVPPMSDIPPLNNESNELSINDKKTSAMKSVGSSVVGAVMKNESGDYAIVVDGRVKDLSKIEFRKLMLYAE
jgi:hypothetical protein